MQFFHMIHNLSIGIRQDSFTESAIPVTTGRILRGFMFSWAPMPFCMEMVNGMYAIRKKIDAGF